jgi:hypothetical protein
MAGDPEPQRPLDRARDPDARAPRGGEIARAIGREDDERAPREVGAVVAQRQAERACEIARAARETPHVGGRAASTRHRPDAGQRLQRSDQHAAGTAGGVGDRVQAVMDAVVEIDVRMAAGAVEQMVAARPEGGVRRLVFGPEVRLHLDDATRGRRASSPRDDDAPQ